MLFFLNRSPFECQAPHSVLVGNCLLLCLAGWPSIGRSLMYLGCCCLGCACRFRTGRSRLPCQISRRIRPSGSRGVALWNRWLSHGRGSSYTQYSGSNPHHPRPDLKPFRGQASRMATHGFVLQYYIISYLPLVSMVQEKPCRGCKCHWRSGHLYARGTSNITA